MKYIADANGYVKDVTFGASIVCGGETCTEYSGAVPSDYESLEAWFAAEHDKLYRWKIVSGNLTLDSSAVEPDSTEAIPISRGGTGAVTAAEALENLGGVSITKLWENASPTSSFAAQTVSLDLSNYDGVVIVAIQDATLSRQYFTNIIFKGVLGALFAPDVTSKEIAKRTATPSDTGVSFGAGYWTNTAYDTSCVPYKIYGIKGVQ